VDTCLDAGFACFVWWGPELVQIYNDAALPIVQARHPHAFGAPVREAWPEMWPAVGAVVRRVMSTGRPSRGASLPLATPDAGPASVSFFCSALRDATGEATGVLLAAFDATGTVFAEPAPRYSALLEAMEGCLTPAFDMICGDACEALRGDNLASWPDLIVRENGGAVTREDPAEGTPLSRIPWVHGAGFPLAKTDVSEEAPSAPSKPATANAASDSAAAERMAFMVAELQHRTRNLIAVVRAIISRTMATSPSPEAFWLRIEERLRALSRVQGLLSRAGQEPVTIGALLRLEFDEDKSTGRGEPRQERVDISGPAIRLRNSMVQTLALAVHELAANARKHGALSIAGGRLRIGWRLEQRENRSWLVLNWLEETPRRPGAPEASKGYGRAFIEHALSYSHGAETCYALDEAGLWCSIALPLGDGAGE
jgi:two-component sensor histidine kinase